MKHPAIPALILAALLTPMAAAQSGCSKKKSTSACAKDTDCKGNRICERGECVDPTRPPSDPLAKAGPATSPRPGTPTAPGAMAPTPGTPSTPGSPGSSLTPPGAPRPGTGAQSALPPFKICIDKDCLTMGPNFGKNPADMAALFGLGRKLFMQGFGKGGAKAPQPKITVCIGKQCVKVDDNLKRDPTALIRLFSQLAPHLFKHAFGGQNPFGSGFPFSRPPTRHGPGAQPRTGAPPIAPSAPTAPSAPAKGLLQDYASIARLGAHAVGREAQLAGLAVTSVSTDRLVLEGPGKEMIVLRVPPARQSAAKLLGLATGKVTLRFRILSPPVGKILHGEFIAQK